MKKLSKDDLIPFQEYTSVQEKFLKSVIEEKKIRRVKLNDQMSGLFETRLSVWFQIQEMIRAEQITQTEYIEEMLQVYNDLIPDDHELSMTLFIEIPDQQELRTFNKSIVGIENCVSMQFGKDHVTSFEPGEAEGNDGNESYTQSVHYLRFPFTFEQLQNFISYDGKVKLSIEHSNYQSKVELPSVLISSLKTELGQP